MSDWHNGPLLGEAAEQCAEAIRRHALAFADQPGGHGLDQLKVETIDLDRIEELLLLIGQDIDLPDLGAIDDFVMVRHGLAVLVGHASARLKWTVYDNGDRRIGADVLPLPVGVFGLTGEAVEELCHKVLAALGLVPWRHLDHLPVDVDGDGYVWLDVEADGSWEARDA